MESRWIYRENGHWRDLPNLYEEVEVLLENGEIQRDEFIRYSDNWLSWDKHEEWEVEAWRYVPVKRKF